MYPRLYEHHSNIARMDRHEWLSIGRMDRHEWLSIARMDNHPK